MSSNKQTFYAAAFALLFWYCCLAITQVNVAQPVNVAVREDKSGECFSERNRRQFHSEVKEMLGNNVVPQFYGLSSNVPAISCADIDHGHPSGYYWLNVGDQPQQVYCSVNENRCCNGGDGNWMRIAYLDMSDPCQQCPHGWREIDSPIRTCRRQFNTSINSVKYSSYGIPYTRVCGRIIAYQYGTPEAFHGYNNQNQRTLDDAYVDGISVTYGQNPRNHIWTFAAPKGSNHICPCISSSDTVTVPPFINGDYFCERGILDEDPNPAFVEGNPLWDGHDCTDSSICCQFNNPPWFCKQLPEPTTEDIEIRQMGYVDQFNALEEEDTPIELMEIYVQ